MRKTLLLSILMITCSISLGQNLKLLVLDSLSNDSLPFANIYFKNSGVGASTDMGGYAIFNLSEIQEQDTLVISYIGYLSQRLPFSKQNSSSPWEIKMVSSSQVLDEVVIAYTKPPKPTRIIKNAVKNIRQNYPEQDVIYHSLYRETIEENGTYIQLNEAFIKTYYTAYPQKKLDSKIWYNYSFDPSYAFDLEGNNYFRPLFKDFNTKRDVQTVVASRHSVDGSKHDIETTLLGDPLHLFALDKIKYQYDFFNLSILNKYFFKLEEAEEINGEVCYVISFYPKTKKQNFRSIQSKKNKYAIYIGRVYITQESKALLRFQYKLAVERDFGFFAPRIPLDYQVEMNYKKRDQLYTIDNIRLTETKKVGTKENGESILHTATKELYALEVQTENVIPFPDTTLFKSTSASALRFYHRNYNPDYWKSANLPDRIDLSHKLVVDLEQLQPLEEQFNSFKKTEKKDLSQPFVFKEPYVFAYHGENIIDSLHWMALPAYKNRLKAYLSEENKWAKNELIEDRKYQKRLFDNLLTFYAKADDSATINLPGTYFVEKDSQYNSIFYFQVDSMEKVAVLDITAFKKEHRNALISRIVPNQSSTLVFVQYKVSGIIGDFISLQPFGGGGELDVVSNVYKTEWLTDSTLIYTKTNEIGRAGELRSRDVLGKSENLIYAERDSTFDIEVVKENAYLFCTIQSKTETEIHLIQTDSGEPELKLIKARKERVTHSIKSSEGFYVLVNDEVLGTYIDYSTFNEPRQFTTLIYAGKKEHIVDFIVLKDRIVALTYDKSIPKLKYFKKGTPKWEELELDLGIGQYEISSSPEHPNSFLLYYSSPSTPLSSFRYDFDSGELVELSKDDLVDPLYYKYCKTARLWAKNKNGVKIPITLVLNRSSKNGRGLILKTYGAYGTNTTPSFDSRDAILLRQGFSIAYAHVRGESILGSEWYKGGRELNKKNSISDYIACAEFLIKKGLTSPKRLVAYGNSAGGMVVAQAINERPELFNTAILDHPFLDVVTTMMCDSLPLTIDEYKELGNPQDKEVFDYMGEYSPYQNIKPQEYPNVFLIGSYKDYQTPIWQIAKYTAKLRENNRGGTSIVLLTDMKGDHIGSTIGTEWIKLFARIYSFVHLKVGEG